MNTLVIAIILGSLLVSSMFYYLINAFKKLKITISPGPAPSPAPSPVPPPNNTVVTITNDGVNFSKPSTTEGYVLNGSINCDPDSFTFDLDIQPDETPNDLLNRKNEFIQSKIGWCEIAGITDPKGFITAYQYHDGDHNASVWNYDTNKCAFSQDPYTCMYKEVKDDDGNVIGFENNEGKKLEVEFYNDYKSGKLKSYMDETGMGTNFRFNKNTDGKLELLNFLDKDKPKKLVIKPGYNYPVTFMLLGTAMTMADNGIDMPVDGVSIKIDSPLSDDEISTNMQNDIVDA
tara:strand:- start:3965 stop:4831 length:867 start_codon:yes stop_codon:yes gene_type:complete